MLVIQPDGYQVSARWLFSQGKPLSREAAEELSLASEQISGGLYLQLSFKLALPGPLPT